MTEIKSQSWRTLNQELVNRPWTVHELVPIVFIPVTLTLLCFLMLSAAKHMGMLKETPLSLIFVTHTLTFHIPILLITACMLRAGGLTLAGAFGIKRGNVLADLVKGVIAYVAALPLIFLSAAIADHYLSQAGFQVESQAPITLLAGSAPLWLKLYVSLTVIFIGPVAEELLFRGIAFPAMAKILGTAASMLLLSLLFGISHQNVFAAMPLFAMAVTMSLAYLATGSLLVPITMHIIFNAVSLVAVFTAASPGA